ncbi:putative HNHc nuclease [Latilactobacillus sakei]|uniref:putative HNHc nuclease n=1 Tax=Latilactobacillus sakei TaxID=1599 RepID=UPI000C1344E4|nr:putative HNHc nuclease [Latilactobacillus sakei]SOB42722.1 hypothetical protein LSAJ112_140109 [Latilactobacillus sakei]
MIFGKLGKYSKHKLKIETDDELDIYKISKYANGRSVSVSVEIEDGRRISPDQRNKLYALFDDYANWTGYSPDEAEALLNYSFIMPLCVNHHTEQHNKGIDSFINYYHIKPVKPDLEMLRILKIRGDYEDKEELDG